jgi:hypothetical protein
MLCCSRADNSSTVILKSNMFSMIYNVWSWYDANRSNHHRSWTVLHSHLSYWWTVILSNWRNGTKYAQHNKKQGPHSLFLQTGNLPSSSSVSIRIFNLTSQIYIEWCRLCCFVGYSEIASWCGIPPYWRPWGDFVDRRFLERGFGINQIYCVLSFINYDKTN